MTNPEESHPQELHPAARRVDRILSARIDRIREAAVSASTALTDADNLRAEADKRKALADTHALKLLELVPRNEAAQMLGIKVSELPKRPARKKAAAPAPGARKEPVES